MTDPDPGGGSGGRGFRWRWLVAVPLAILGLLAVASFAGVVGQPTAGVVDHEWGTVTEERIEVVTTVWVNNPNPVGAQFGDGPTVEYDVRLNGVRVAQGSKTDIDVPAGNSTERLRTEVDTDQLPAWWVAFLRDDETVHADFAATIEVDAGRSVTYTVERNRTMMADSRPIVGAASAVADQAEGRYTTTVSLDEDIADRLEEFGLEGGTEATVGYEVERGWATLESVSRERTTLGYHFRLHNPGDVPLPATPDGVELTVAANDVPLFETEADAFSLRNVSADEVLEPGETREVILEVHMDNERVEDWFRSHVRRGEQSAVSTRLRLVFDHPVRDEAIRLPAEEPVTYECEFRTTILVDDQEAGTDCEDPATPA